MLELIQRWFFAANPVEAPLPRKQHGTLLRLQRNVATTLVLHDARPSALHSKPLRKAF